jgi:hypothetical protein
MWTGDERRCTIWLKDATSCIFTLFTRPVPSKEVAKERDVQRGRHSCRAAHSWDSRSLASLHDDDDGDDGDDGAKLVDINLRGRKLQRKEMLFSDQYEKQK